MFKSFALMAAMTAIVLASLRGHVACDGPISLPVCELIKHLSEHCNASPYHLYPTSYFIELHFNYINCNYNYFIIINANIFIKAYMKVNTVVFIK